MLIYMVVFIEVVCEFDWNFIFYFGNFLVNKKFYVFSE